MKQRNFRSIFSVFVKINFFVLVTALVIRLEHYTNIDIQAKNISFEKQVTEYQESLYFKDPNYSTNNYIQNEKAIIDYSKANYGYVKVKFTENTKQKLKVTIESSKNRYLYCLPKLEWVVLPLTEGNDNYTVSIYENVKGSKYAVVLKKTFDINLLNEFCPFLNSSLYVNFSIADKAIKKANDLTYGMTSTSDKIEAIYNFIIENISYDYEKAENVKSGYVPVVDEILETKKGICFDYSALACAMLRSQNIPCKMVVGYVGDSYHAWISVYVEEDDVSICGMTYYDSEHWLHMDPTYSASKEKVVEEYINEGTNYSAMYVY